MHDRATMPISFEPIGSSSHNTAQQNTGEGSHVSAQRPQQANSSTTTTTRHRNSTAAVGGGGGSYKMPDKKLSPLISAKTFRSNASWAYLRGVWTTNIFVVILMKCLFSIIPGVSNEASWTMTNVCYNLVNLFIFCILLFTIVLY